MNRQKPSKPADLFLRYAADLRSFLRIRRGAADAEDLVQDSFVRLLQTSVAVAPDDPRAGCTGPVPISPPTPTTIAWCASA